MFSGLDCYEHLLTIPKGRTYVLTSRQMSRYRGILYA
jgi:hypothetical protein